MDLSQGEGGFGNSQHEGIAEVSVLKLRIPLGVEKIRHPLQSRSVVVANFKIYQILHSPVASAVLAE